MAQNEMPAVGYSNYASSQALNLNEHLLNQNLNQAARLNQVNQFGPVAQAQEADLNQRAQQLFKTKPKEPPMTTRRLVQVFIVDPHDSVPLDDCLLYRGDLKITDCTDQELFYEIDIQSILKTHNEKRTKLVDKKVKERTEHLEPARIRDLKMQIVEVAKF